MKRTIALALAGMILFVPAIGATPRKLQPSLENRTQALYSGATTGISSAAVSDYFTPAYDSYFPSRIHIEVEFTGTITNQEVTISLRRKSPDGNAVISDVITRPYQVLASDSAKTTGEFTFDTRLSPTLAIGLESAITGGGTVKLFYRFSDAP